MIFDAAYGKKPNTSRFSCTSRLRGALP